MAAPTLVTASITTVATVGSLTATLNVPAGVVAGDLLIAIVGNDANSAEASSAVWGSVAGWTNEMTGGDGVSDSYYAVYSRVATGTEAASYAFTSTTATLAGSVDSLGWMMRITGADTSGFNVKGAAQASGSALTFTITAITTTVADCLAFYVLVADGGDTFPFSVDTGTSGFTEVGELQAGTGSANTGGCFGTKTISAAGTTGAPTVTISGTAENAARVLFAIAPTGVAVVAPVSLVMAPRRGTR